MARPTAVTRSRLAEAVRRIRLQLEETQEEFARRLGVSVGSVARYETNARPSQRVIRKLRDLARDVGRFDLMELLGILLPTVGVDEGFLLERAFSEFMRHPNPRRMRMLKRVLQKEFTELETSHRQLESKIIAGTSAARARAKEPKTP